jgi:hypothetical protein
MSSWTVYPLRLGGHANPEQLFKTTVLEDARRRGAKISGFLELPLADRSGEAPSAS